MRDFEPNNWALILGGSSGFGLATAKKLASHGMNVFIAHRDSRQGARRLESELETIRNGPVQVVTYNGDALSPEGINNILEQLKGLLAADGKLKLCLHSIAFGNLKPLAPPPSEGAQERKRAMLLERLEKELRLEKGVFQDLVNQYFVNGHEELVTLASPPAFAQRQLMEEDFALTLYSMGSSLASWVRLLLKEGLFSADARVLSFTSEGNSIVWKGYGAVAAAKAVLESIIKSIAVEYAPYGIRANVIQAGVTDSRALRMIPGHQQIMAKSILRNPFNRLTRPEDVANVVYLLCQKEAAWISGSLIKVDGGESISS